MDRSRFIAQLGPSLAQGHRSEFTCSIDQHMDDTGDDLVAKMRAIIDLYDMVDQEEATGSLFVLAAALYGKEVCDE